MNRALSVVTAIVFLSPCPVYALYTHEDRGNWPESWPKELEGLRGQSRTFNGPLAGLLHYAIPFAKREAFEAAWPHLLKVKTSGAPIVLRCPPSLGFDGDKSKAGVCIHTPPEGEAPIEDAKKAGERWWESAVSAEGAPLRTIYIELIVDGDIVDLNRIRLPPDTPIIDERFKDASPKP